jgi:hypothetical protein
VVSIGKSGGRNLIGRTQPVDESADDSVLVFVEATHGCAVPSRRRRIVVPQCTRELGEPRDYSRFDGTSPIDTEHPDPQ